MKTKKIVVLSQKEEGGAQDLSDAVVCEGALQVLINGRAFTVTMRMPDHDFYLARGLAFTEGVIVDENVRISHELKLADSDAELSTIDLRLSVEKVKLSHHRRSQVSSASCGLCGKMDWHDVVRELVPVEFSEQIEIDALMAMLGAMQDAQLVFQQTGGAHGAGAFTSDGRCLQVFEDIGRHNAVDKVVGALLENRQLGQATCLVVSSRVSYEIIAKACRADFAFLVAVSAPSSLAIEMAQSLGITLIGFCRPPRYSIYTHAQRVLIANEVNIEK